MVWPTVGSRTAKEQKKIGLRALLAVSILATRSGRFELH